MRTAKLSSRHASHERIASTRLSSKGQIILPKTIRDSHAWGQGTEFTVEATVDGILLRMVHRLVETDLDEVAGCLPIAGKPKTLAEMDAGVRDEVIRRNDSGRY